MLFLKPFAKIFNPFEHRCLMNHLYIKYSLFLFLLCLLNASVSAQTYTVSQTNPSGASMSDGEIQVDWSYGKMKVRVLLDGTKKRKPFVFKNKPEGTYSVSLQYRAKKQDPWNTYKTIEVVLTAELDTDDPVINCPPDINVDADDGKCEAFINVPGATFTDNSSTFIINYNKLEIDGFESYSVGEDVGLVSSNWTTWSGNEGGVDDVKVVSNKVYEGSNAIYFTSNNTSGGPQDLVLPFGSMVNSGKFYFESYFFIPNGKAAYFNFQESESLGDSWAIDVYMNTDGSIDIRNGQVDVLNSVFTFDQWFKVSFLIDFDANDWEFFINDVSQGNWTNPVNQIASLNIYPSNENAEFWVDNVSYGTFASVIAADASGNYPVGITMVNYTAIDDSGNKANCSTKITVADAQPPSFSSTPGDLNVDGVKPPAYPDYSTFQTNGGEATDNCTVDFTSFKHVSDEIVSNDPEVVDRTYSIADNSGNIKEYVQTISINLKPKITDFNPKNACEGGEIVITGSNFTGTTSVDFSGTSTNDFVVDNDTQVKVNVPVGATPGFLKVVNSDGFGESGDPLAISQPHKLSAIVLDNDCGSDNQGEIDLTVDAGLSASLDFTNTNQPVDLNNNFLSDRGAFTLEGWVKFTANMASGQHSFFGQNDVIEFGFENGALTCWTRRAGNVKYTITNYPTDGEWHHVAVVGTGSSLSLYIDGVQKVSRNHTSVSSYGSSSYSVKIGAGVWDATKTNDPLNGEISVVRFWNVARTSTEISDGRFIKMTGSEPGLLAAYRLDEAVGNQVTGVGSDATTVNFSTAIVWDTYPSQYAYTWTTGSNNEDIKDLNTGTYGVTVSVPGCTVSGSYEVKMKNPKPKPIGIFHD